MFNFQSYGDFCKLRSMDTRENSKTLRSYTINNAQIIFHCKYFVSSMYTYRLLTKTETKTETLRSWFYFIISHDFLLLPDYLPFYLFADKCHSEYSHSFKA